MFGLSGSEIMEIVDFSQDVRQCLEEIKQALDDSRSSLAEIALRFEPAVGMSVEVMIEKLATLEQAINEGNAEQIAEVRDAVEAYNDYLDLELEEVFSPGGGPTRNYDVLHHLRVWKRSAGKLGQGLSLMSEDLTV
jgi:DNA-binding transcriptional MerR regulator